MLNFIKYTILRKLRKQPHKIRMNIVKRYLIGPIILRHIIINMFYQQDEKTIIDSRIHAISNGGIRTTYRTNLRLDKWCEI